MRGEAYLTGLFTYAGIRTTIPLRVLEPASLDEIMRVNFHSGVMIARGFLSRRAAGHQVKLALFFWYLLQDW